QYIRLCRLMVVRTPLHLQRQQLRRRRHQPGADPRVAVPGPVAQPQRPQRANPLRRLPHVIEVDMIDYQTIEVERDARGFATLWLNRPDRNNAFNAQMIRELTAALKGLDAEPELRFLLLRGRGRHFSAGAD